jgi:hypothetical protein
MTARRKPSVFLSVVASFLVLLAAACTPVADPLPTSEVFDGSGSELRLRWARWQMTGIRSYGFNLERSCFCTPETVMPVRVDVRDGRVVTVRALTDGQSLPSQLVPTIDSLFRWAIREADAGGRVEASYDPLLGFPVRIVIGTLENDAGVAYHVADLVPAR